MAYFLDRISQAHKQLVYVLRVYLMYRLISLYVHLFILFFKISFYHIMVNTDDYKYRSISELT